MNQDGSRGDRKRLILLHYLVVKLEKVGRGWRDTKVWPSGELKVRQLSTFAAARMFKNKTTYYSTVQFSVEEKKQWKEQISISLCDTERKNFSLVFKITKCDVSCQSRVWDQLNYLRVPTGLSPRICLKEQKFFCHSTVVVTIIELQRTKFWQSVPSDLVFEWYLRRW